MDLINQWSEAEPMIEGLQKKESFSFQDADYKDENVLEVKMCIRDRFIVVHFLFLLSLLIKHIDQVPERCFKFGPVPMICIALGIDDAFHGIIRSNFCSFKHTLVVHQCAGECGRIDIAGSVAAL